MFAYLTLEYRSSNGLKKETACSQGYWEFGD